MTNTYKLKQPHRDTIKRVARDKDIYQWYLNFMTEKGRPPTLREIGKNYGHSKQRAAQILNRLGEEGYLVKLKKYPYQYIPNIFSGHSDGKKIWIEKELNKGREIK